MKTKTGKKKKLISVDDDSHHHAIVVELALGHGILGELALLIASTHENVSVGEGRSIVVLGHHVSAHAILMLHVVVGARSVRLVLNLGERLAVEDVARDALAARLVRRKLLLVLFLDRVQLVGDRRQLRYEQRRGLVVAQQHLVRHGALLEVAIEQGLGVLDRQQVIPDALLASLERVRA